MPRLHHSNLGIRPEQRHAEHAFLVDVLGFRPLPPPAGLEGVAHWYGDDGGAEVHLSLDPDHKPASMAHTAIEIDADVARRLDDAGIGYDSGDFGGVHLVFCTDPAGNRWELRMAFAGDAS